MSRYENKHCFICNYVYYDKENLCLPKETFKELDLQPLPTSGVYHRKCLENYFDKYVPFLNENEKNNLRSDLELFIEAHKQHKEERKKQKRMEVQIK